MSEILNILTIEVPAPGAYAIWVVGAPLIAWLASAFI